MYLEETWNKTVILYQICKNSSIEMYGINTGKLMMLCTLNWKLPPQTKTFALKFQKYYASVDIVQNNSTTISWTNFHVINPSIYATFSE